MARQDIVAPTLSLDAPTNAQDNSQLQQPAPLNIDNPTSSNVEEAKVDGPVLEKGLKPFGSLFGGELPIPNLFGNQAPQETLD